MGRFIVKFRKIILLVAAILMIPALIGFLNTHVNYDMLNYLPSDTETMRGQKELMDEFGKGAFSMIIVKDLPAEEELKLENKLKTIGHVDTVLGLGALTEKNIPTEILPEEAREAVVKGDESLIAVFFDTSSSADETIKAINEIRGLMDGHIYVSGMSAFVVDLRALSESEQIYYIIIAVILAMLVMWLLLDNWLSPVLFMVSIGMMILLNLGTNWVFGEISYITKALSAILQLAVTMDYSIFLWHSYRENLATLKKPEPAMEAAVKATLGSVFGSSATTIAGFLALCFMTFGLGLDLGLVMAKGVVLGVIGAVTVLPALILTFNKALIKCDHRPLMPKFDKLSRVIVKIAPALVVIFVAIIPPFYYAYDQTNNNVYYTLSDSLPQDMDFAVANKKLADDFGLSNVHMILTDAKLGQAEMNQMTDELASVPGIKSVMNLESVIGTNVPEEALPSSLVALTKSDKRELTLAISEYHTATDEMSEQITKINEIIKRRDGSSLLVGEAALTEDMIKVTSRDFAVVNIISIVAIFIIIAIVTKSISLPFILIAVIESAIFLNLGFSHFIGEKLSFIAPICISTIQLGATIDYAILMTTRYKAERLAGRDKRDAATIALKTSIPSIVVSGAVLFAATIGVAVYSRADMISSLTMLMARGAIISIVVVPAFLAPMLILTDPLVIRTTIGMKKLIKEKKK